MAGAARSRRVFRDPVHDIIAVPASARVLLELLETEAVQRLRRIRQLGMAHLVFPGAEHTRFVHSLGVLHLAGRILSRLGELGAGDADVEATLARGLEIQAAALLHDVGHGPFSHTFEKVLDETLGNHEAWSRRIILEPASEVHRTLTRYGLDPPFVAALVEGRAQDLLAQDIVSSQLDADRLDYLLRDSLMTGVAYGKIDLAWILNVMQPGRAPDGRVRLGVDVLKGLHAVESYLFARRSIHLQVYHHRTVGAFEAMLANTLDLARFHLHEGALSPDTPASVRALLGDRPLTVEEFLTLDDTDIHMALKSWARSGPPPLRRLAEALLRRRCLYEHLDLGRDPVRADAVAASVADLRARKDPRMAHFFFFDWQGTLYETAEAALRAGHPRRDAYARVIPIVEPDGTVRPLEEGAPWLDLMRAFPTRIARLYYDPAHRDELQAVLPVRLG